jgi:NAD(P)-dependent dehydrogenase (short-subunit alcohol dehydrogenase family)
MGTSVAPTNSAGAWLGLENAAVLIAGAGGIGRALIEGFAGAGARVVAVDNDARRVAAAVYELELERRGGAGLVADLRDPDRARAVVAQAAERLGAIDVFVHALGINDRKPIVDYTDDEWRRFIDVNLNSAFWLGQAAGKLMCARGYGRQIYFSSVAGSLAHKNHGPYAATKGGINQMMRVMANEWAAQGVTVNALAPGYIETPLTAEHLAKPGVRAALEALVPAGRLGVVDDVVGPALFLASRHAAFVTGQVLFVDGGRTLI